MIKPIYINFDKIKENYWNNLNNKLRGFVADVNLSFLDLWVPDENETKCILDIILYAKEGDIDCIEFELNKELYKSLTSFFKLISNSIVNKISDKNLIVIDLKKITKDNIDDLNIYFKSKKITSKVLKVKKSNIFKRNNVNKIDLLSIYEKSLYLYINKSPKLLSEKYNQNCLVIDFSIDRVNFKIHIEKTSFKMINFYYESFGGIDNNIKSIMNIISILFYDIHLQEIKDHGLIYLENFTRDKLKEHPIKGIISYDNCELSFFNFADKIITNLYSQFEKESNYVYTENFHYMDVNPLWKNKINSERMEIIKDLIKNIKKYDIINVEGQLDVKRTIVSFKEDISIRKKQSKLLDFESYLKNNVDKRLEVFQQMKQDKNKLRDGRLDVT